MNRETPGDRRILLDSLACRPSGEHAAISLRTGHRLNLLLPERKTPPELVIRNTGLEPLELTGTLTISDAGDGIRTEPVSCRIAPGGEAMLPLPGDYMQQGWWKVDYRLKGASGKEFAGTHRFARMNPAGPTPERAQEFLFGLCGHPERFSPEEAELEALAAGPVISRRIRRSKGVPACRITMTSRSSPEPSRTATKTGSDILKSGTNPTS